MWTLNTGPFHDLERSFVEDFLKTRGTDPLLPVAVLVPSGTLRTRLQRRLLEQPNGPSSILNTTFVDFYGLAHHVLSESPAHSATVVTEPALFAELIRDLLEGHGDFALQLRSELHHPGRPLLDGLPHALADSLRDLRDSGARVVDSLRVALEGHLGDAGDPAAPALELYARVYETLQSRNLRSSADVLRWAKDLLPTSTFFNRQSAIFVYGFYDMTGVQLDFLAALLRHPKARLYFPYEENNPAYAFAERLLTDPMFARASERRRAAASGPSPTLPRTDAPTQEIWSCSGAHDEVWATAKQILKLADAGVAYRDMLVSARSLNGYSDAIAEIFSVHRIPYSLDAEESVASFPLMKAMRLLLTLDRDHYPALATTDLLRCAYIRPRWPDPAALDRLVSATGVIRGWESWNERLAVWSKRAAPTEFPQAPSVARELLERVTRLHDDFSSGLASDLWSRHALWAQAMIEKWMALPSDASAKERLLWEKILEGLGELSVLDAIGHPVSRERFLRVWEEKIDAWKISFQPSAHAGVTVMDVMKARGLRFETIFVLGMNEKSFPRLIREDPFLPDAARSALAHALGCRLGRKMDGYPEERLLFEFLREAADKHFYISYQRSDEDGKATVPSLYLQGRPTDRVIPRPPVEKWRRESPTVLTPKELSVFWNRDHINSSALHALTHSDVATYELLCAKQALLEEFEPALGPLDGLVGPRKPVAALYQAGLSPASLNDLAECPFRYFARKILDLPNDVLTEIEEGDLPKDTAGILIHRILEHFYASVPADSFSKLSYDEIRSLLENAFEKGFRSLRETGIDIYPLVWEAERQLIWERVDAFVQRDWKELVESGFRPSFFEIDVEGVIPQLGADLSGYPFHGRIDRIDLEPGTGRYRIIDYKTGRPTAKDSDGEKAVLKGRFPQLPIYLGLTADWIAKKQKTAATGDGAYFYNLADFEQGRESPSLGPDFWETAGKLYSENLAAWLKLAKGGVFYIRPSDERGYCSWCSFATLCRKEHVPSAWRSLHSRDRQRVEETVKKNGSPKKLDH